MQQFRVIGKNRKGNFEQLTIFHKNQKEARRSLDKIKFKVGVIREIK